MTDHHPRVSIGLPVYNGEKYLAAAIDSLLGQTFTDFELIISDNASTDGTEEICRAYAEQDARIRYYREAENRGIAWNFTRTFELARGEFFKWHAHDDTCAPTLIERCVQAFDADPQAVLCYARPAVIDDMGELLSDDPATWRPRGKTSAVASVNLDPATVEKLTDADLRGLDSPSAARRFHGVLLETVWCLESYGMVRTDVMRTTGKLRGYCGAEKVFLAEMALRGEFKEIPEILFFPRRHAQQYTMLNTGSAQRRSVRPQRFKLRLPVPRQMHPTLGYLLLLPAAPISWLDRLRCLGVLFRYVLQVGKWKQIVVSTMHDAGITDGHLHVPQGKVVVEKPEGVPQSRPRRTSAPVSSA